MRWVELLGLPWSQFSASSVALELCHIVTWGEAAWRAHRHPWTFLCPFCEFKMISKEKIFKKETSKLKNIQILGGWITGYLIMSGLTMRSRKKSKVPANKRKWAHNSRNLWDTVEAVLRGILVIATQVYPKKRKKISNKQPNSTSKGTRKSKTNKTKHSKNWYLSFSNYFKNGRGRKTYKLILRSHNYLDVKTR